MPGSRQAVAPQGTVRSMATPYGVACMQHLGEYFSAVERMLKSDGVFVIESITTLEAFYEDAAKVGGGVTP